MKPILISIFCFSIFCDCESINGRWNILKNKEWSIYHYPVIEFEEKSLVILHSYGDTIYTGNYLLRGKTIFLKIGNEKQEVKILKCKKDTLILTGFVSTTDTLTYIKE